MNDSDRTEKFNFWAELVQANYQVNKDQIELLKQTDKQLTERLTSVEDSLISIHESIKSHSRKSLSSQYYLHLLIVGLFVCFFLLGFDFDGNKFTYSGNKVTQILLQIFSAGGVAVAIANSPKIKNMLKK
jgi:predicted PurR-regulated permease PerM